MTMPDYYGKFYRLYLRFSIVMLVVALLMGIMFQESAKKAPVSAALPAGAHLESIINLALVHECPRTPGVGALARSGFAGPAPALPGRLPSGCPCAAPVG